MKKKILLLVLLIVILLGAGIAYAYFETDVFKTEKEIFFSHLIGDKIFEDNEVQDKLSEYFNKKETTPYSNDGKATINMISDDTADGINNVTLDFEGKSDFTKKLVEQKLTIDLSQGFNIPVEFKMDGDTYGIQSDFIDSKYVAIKNENLKALAERFDIDATNIPDKIELENTSFSEEEINTLKEKYLTILNDNLEEELFTKEKVNSETIITLKMTEKKTEELFKIICENLKEDEIILSKLPEDSQNEFKDSIQEALDDLENIDSSENNFIEIRMYIEKRIAKKYEMIVVEDTEATATIVIEKADNKILVKIYDETELLLDASLEIQKVENDAIITLTLKMEDDNTIFEANAKMQYKNLFTLENIEEIADVEIKNQVNGNDYYYTNDYHYTNYTNSNTEISLNCQNNITFSPDLQIEGFNKENAIIINDATDEELQSLILKIYQKMGLI